MTIASQLNALLLDAIVKTGTPPPYASRILAVFNTAIYDAWAMYKNRPLPVRLPAYLRRPEAEHTRANRETAIVWAAFEVLTDYFQTALTKNGFPTLLADAMQAFGFDPTDATAGTDSAVGLGKLAAKTILDFRRGDGSNFVPGPPPAYADWTGYAPALGPTDVPTGELQSRWQPLTVPQADGTTKTSGFLAPHWGTVVPFALRNGWEFRPVPGPEPHYSPRFKSQCEEVLTISEKLTDEQKCIAEYWSDGPKSVTPPGHWMQLAAEFADRENYSLGREVRLFFAVSNALMDAGIACWESKRHFNYVRPVTAIRHLWKGKKIRAWGGPDFGGVRTTQGEEWHPYQGKFFVTPPFAEFPSGHSTFSSAAATVLRQFTGSNLMGLGADIATGSSKLETGVPSHVVQLHWRTFSEAAAQAGQSRLFGGIHFEDGNLHGLEMGEKVGEKVWAKCQRLFLGV